MIATKPCSESNAASAKADRAGGRLADRSKTDLQNWLAFAVILLVSVLVFLIGGALAMNTAVKPPDLTADARLY